MLHPATRSTAAGVIAGLALTVLAPLAHAQVFKCTTDGKVTLQQTPCLDGERVDGAGRRTVVADKGDDAAAPVGKGRDAKGRTSAGAAKPGESPATTRLARAAASASAPAQGE